jgi:hypothetical protein
VNEKHSSRLAMRPQLNNHGEFFSGKELFGFSNSTLAQRSKFWSAIAIAASAYCLAVLTSRHFETRPAATPEINTSVLTISGLRYALHRSFQIIFLTS